MTLLSIVKMIFRYFKAISLNEQTELFISMKYSVCLKPVHSLGHTLWFSKNKRMIQQCTNTVNLLLRKTPLGENSDVCLEQCGTCCTR